MATTPFAQWRENKEPDPFGTEYDGDMSRMAKGHITDHIELAKSIGFMIGDKQAAKDRIRYLSRKLYRLIQEKGVSIHRYNKERAKLVNGDLTDDNIANEFYLEDYSSYQEGAKARIIWLAESIKEIETN